MQCVRTAPLSQRNSLFANFSGLWTQRPLRRGERLAAQAREIEPGAVLVAQGGEEGVIPDLRFPEVPLGIRSHLQASAPGGRPNGACFECRPECLLRACEGPSLACSFSRPAPLPFPIPTRMRSSWQNALATTEPTASVSSSVT